MSIGSPTSFNGPYGRVLPVTPPLKGSFPIDYEKDCHLEMLKYVCCLKLSYHAWDHSGVELSRVELSVTRLGHTYPRPPTREIVVILQEKNSQNSECRDRVYDYFKCRMDHGLMDKDEWPKLGLKEFEKQYR